MAVAGWIVAEAVVCDTVERLFVVCFEYAAGEWAGLFFAGN